MDSGQDAAGHSGPQLSDSLRLFLQETSAFKQQNPGKVSARIDLLVLKWMIDAYQCVTDRGILK